MNQATIEKSFRFNTYLLISLMLALPVMLWPLPLYFGLTPEVDGAVQRNWLIAACLLLLAATVADSVVSGARSLKQMLLHIAWISISVALISIVLRESGSTYLLGVMFFLHALRSSVVLWHHGSGWWLWPAWMRDAGTALVIFFWLAFWPG